MPPRDSSCYPGSQEACREAFDIDFAIVRRPRPVFALRRSTSLTLRAVPR
jgi:hypothetical protein